jgi:hypothetical protein
MVTFANRRAGRGAARSYEILWPCRQLLLRKMTEVKEKMFFSLFPMVIGEVMALEGLRRGILGSIQMACFIELTADTRIDLSSLLQSAQTINDLGWEIYEVVPHFLRPLATGYYDLLIGVN